MAPMRLDFSSSARETRIESPTPAAPWIWTAIQRPSYVHRVVINWHFQCDYPGWSSLDGYTKRASKLKRTSPRMAPLIHSIIRSRRERSSESESPTETLSPSAESFRPRPFMIFRIPLINYLAGFADPDLRTMSSSDASLANSRSCSRRQPASLAGLVLVNVVLLLLLSPAPAAAQSQQLSSTVYFRKHSLGSIFAVDSRSNDPLKETELEGTATASRIVALALSPTRLYWSDAHSIRSAFTANGSDIRVAIGSLVRVRWFGVNFGTDRSDLQSLTVRNTPCVSVLGWSPTFVECIVALPFLDALVGEDDCVITTTRGYMRGVARNNYEEMRASGLPSPIVERLEIDQSPVAPRALAIDVPSNGLFWSNAIDGTIYRSSLTDTSINAVQTNAWEVKGIVLLRWPSLELVFSLEGKGLIRRARIATGSAASQQPGETLLSDLRSPRGLAIDPAQRFLYWTEKTGRVYRVDLSSLTALSPSAQLPRPQLPKPQLPKPQLLLTLPTLTRLDGIAVDDMYAYWCEANANVVARAAIDSFEREVLVGGTADSALSWPRSIALLSTNGARNTANQDFFFTEYTGRISKGKALVLVDQLQTSTMKYVDQLLKQYDSLHTHFYALE